MRFPCLILLCLFVPFIAIAQNGIISGVITNADTRSPVPRASVFLSNSSVGSATTDNGNYILNGIRPGQYTLIVTILGYEEYSKSILVGREPIKLDIELKPKPLMLREVVISSAADWKKNYESFRKDFIGTDENAKDCIVMNPHILNLVYNRTKQTLEANADEFLVVENRALGYRVKFLLKDFKSDRISGIISYEGQRLFEELPGGESQKKKWHEKREEAYHGSAMHFYRSLYTNKLSEDGFVMYRFRRELNPDRPAEDVIRRKIKIYSQERRNDSVNFWIGLANMSKYSHEYLDRLPLSMYEVMTNTGQPGIFAVHFTNYLYIVYTKKRDEVFNKDLYRPLDMPNYETSVITLLSSPYVVFDMNGIVVGDAPLYEGSWAKAKLSDLLPVDYVPDESNSSLAH
jgi:hypothetical protein